MGFVTVLATNSWVLISQRNIIVVLNTLSLTFKSAILIAFIFALLQYERQTSDVCFLLPEITGYPRLFVD